jgi:hypothetical protein
VHGLYKASYFEHGGKRKSRLRAYYVTSLDTLPQKPGGNTKWYRYIVSTVPKPTNTRHNPTVKRSVCVELVPAKTKTTTRLTAYYVTSPDTLSQKPGGNTKWYRDMGIKVPKPTNTRQNPTVKRSVRVELVPAKMKTTNESSAPAWKRKRQNDDDIQQTKNANYLHPEPAEPEQAEPPSVIVVNPPNVTAEAILTQSWWDTVVPISYFDAIDGQVSSKVAVLERITRLQRGYTTATGWKLAVIDDFDQQDLSVGGMRLFISN